MSDQTRVSPYNSHLYNIMGTSEKNKEKHQLT